MTKWGMGHVSPKKENEERVLYANLKEKNQFECSSLGGKVILKYILLK
jgi:hypothetical protein